MRDSTGNHVLEPESTKTVLLDQYDRYIIQEALIEFADNNADEEWSEHFERLGYYIQQ